MKTTSLKKVSSINEFLKKKIKNTESIVGGGGGGAIDRDKIKKTRR
ncbi:hypothetical protein ACFFU9_15020 [Mariniflexile ostreae]|uniref:Bacteriocin-like protein n=1 Tax=Mariniflexile ostreae TaxID=1520892 RepID=A0ABV5FFC9_9FLAO